MTKKMTTVEKTVVEKEVVTDVSDEIKPKAFVIKDKLLCCVYCGSIDICKNGRDKNGRQIYKCKDCEKHFTFNPKTAVYRREIK